MWPHPPYLRQPERSIRPGAVVRHSWVEQLPCPP